MGPVAFRDALARTDGVDAALSGLSPEARRVAEAKARELEREAQSVGATLLVQGDSAYPAAMLDLEDAPAYLFTLGDPAWLTRPMVAIVGTRDATGYGERIAARLAQELAEAGVTVVSGLARGIDSAAHRGALARTGGTVAVVAGGVDLPTPPRHRELHAAIVARGLVLSEQPCGATPRAGAFPRRNRLIAALGAATVVVEAGIRSGARLTASLANDLGRPLGAVPGSIESPVSEGANALLRDGATPITGVADILALAGLTGVISSAWSAPTPPRPSFQNNPLGEVLWHRLRHESATLDALVTEMALTPRDVLSALTSLEVAGLIRAEASLYAAF